MKKTVFLALFSLFLYSQEVKAIDAPPQDIPNIPFNNLTPLAQFEFHGNVNFAYDYSFGFSKIQDGKVLKDSSNNIILDDRFRNYLYIQNANFEATVNIARLLHINLSGALLANGLTPEPLYNPDSYKDFAKFLDDRKKGTKNIWQRLAILQDLNIAVKDPSIDGSLIIGQQIVPFGYNSINTLTPNIVTTAIITPMTEYFNYNLRNLTDTPYQTSSLTNIRDIGISLSGNYSTFRFFTALYNGAGPNTFDNNNEKDIFARFDYILPNIAEAGFTHWRGRHVGFKTIYSDNPTRVEYEMYRTGFHGMIGNKDLNLKGEILFNQDSWFDKTDISTLGWYLEGFFKAPTILSAAARYESLYDNNVLKNQNQSANYIVRRFVGSLSQDLANSIRFKQEYVHTWEDYVSKSGDKANTNFGVFTVSIGYTF
ncbi:MAG: hypothetical protein U0354_05490 [Candidatus Sericytochromatia bacterium]